ncbi:protein of unknown function [Xenorhabdus doucetiae]|uniref:Uncharacterized protein n=1 Tax=Xenorhabdus doucetiae TaxID=351671 RepID=A0A068QUV6_9GAMM|nr:protein of unknown function [Xenorhabdus doucetiae]
MAEVKAGTGQNENHFRGLKIINDHFGVSKSIFYLNEFYMMICFPFC